MRKNKFILNGFHGAARVSSAHVMVLRHQWNCSTCRYGMACAAFKLLTSKLTEALSDAKAHSVNVCDK